MRFVCVLSLICIGESAAPVLAADMDCGELAAIAKVAGAKNESELIAQARQIGSSYFAQSVFAARSFEIRNDRNSAAILLDLLPKNDEQRVIWGSLGQAVCDRETVSEAKLLGRLRDRLAKNVAQAVILAPEKMLPYVVFSLGTTSDPHSEYALEMKRVCLRKKGVLTEAVEMLAEHEKRWFHGHVMALKNCQALDLPESD